MRFLLLLFISTLFGAAFSSCKQEQIVKKIALDEIQGRWEMYNAFRSNRPTRTLLGTYFDIKADSVATNLFSEFGSFPFHYQFPNLYIDKNQAVSLRVESLQNDSIYFSTQFKGYDFDFYMKRAN